MRTARVQTSGENLVVVLLMRAPPSQELEPPTIPGRITTVKNQLAKLRESTRGPPRAVAQTWKLGFARSITRTSLLTRKPPAAYRHGAARLRTAQITEPHFFIDTLSGRLSVAGNRAFYDQRRAKRVHISSYPSPI